jgi:hypothetical protein
MSIMDRIFGTKTEAPPGNTTVTNSGVDPSLAAGNTTLPNPNAPGSTGQIAAIPTKAEGSKSPFEEYKDLWQPPKEGEKTGVPNPLPPFALDPKQLETVAKGIDFTAGITSEQLQEAFPGVKETSARAILNSMHQTSFMNTFSTGLKTVEGAMTHQTKVLTEKTLPEMLRRNNASELNRSSTDTASLFSDPATAPLAMNLERQFTDKYPAASPEQIRDYVGDFFGRMMEQTAKDRGYKLEKVVTQGEQTKDVDWGSWAGIPGNA